MKPKCLENQIHNIRADRIDENQATPSRPLTDGQLDQVAGGGIVFSGGWGMAQYQYGFEGTYS